MLRFCYLFLIFIVSCSSNDEFVEAQVQFDDEYNVENIETYANIYDYYEFNSFQDFINSLNVVGVNQDELDVFEIEANSFFEIAPNKSSKDFLLEQSDMQINIAIINSIEIIGPELFCREFSQKVNFRVAEVAVNGISCRDDQGWRILRKIN